MRTPLVAGTTAASKSGSLWSMAGRKQVNARVVSDAGSE